MSTVARCAWRNALPKRMAVMDAPHQRQEALLEEFAEAYTNMPLSQVSELHRRTLIVATAKPGKNVSVDNGSRILIEPMYQSMLQQGFVGAPNVK